MKTIYKYYPFTDINYFKEPTIKISAIENLNDPFEYKHSEDIREVIKETFKESGLKENFLNSQTDEYMNYFQHTLDNNGIVSFSETPRNSLLWAHYANNHKGMCIGYKNHLLDTDKNKTDSNFNISLLTPEKIEYDNKRVSPDYLPAKEIVNIKQLDSLYKDFVRKHLLKKSDEWIYEKEHRSIVPYTIANKIRFKPNEIFYEKMYQSDVIDVMLQKGMIEKNPILDDTYDIIEVSDGYLWNLKNKESISLLLDIEINDIQSIYLGCKTESGFTEKVFNFINESQLPIKLYKSKVSKTRFEIEQHLVTHDTLKELINI